MISRKIWEAENFLDFSVYNENVIFTDNTIWPSNALEIENLSYILGQITFDKVFLFSRRMGVHIISWDDRDKLFFFKELKHFPLNLTFMTFIVKSF